MLRKYKKNLTFFPSFLGMIAELFKTAYKLVLMILKIHRRMKFLQIAIKTRKNNTDA